MGLHLCAIDFQSCAQDWYNALLHNVDEEDSSAWLATSLAVGQLKAARRLLARYHKDALADFMNSSVRKKVGIIPDHVTWGGQSGKVPCFENPFEF